MPEGWENEVREYVRMGFCPDAEILTIFSEEVYAPGEIDPQALRRTLEEAAAAHQAEQGIWPVETDCDRLTRAFAALRARGIVALENAGNDQSDGYDDFRDACAAAPPGERILGYCFYHHQDLERAVRGEGLMLSFGPVDPEREDDEGPAIGRCVVEELARAGFSVHWDGTFNRRIHVERIDWKRRR